jgi:formylglycine-generating enzyme required for sulfatase activity
LAEHIEGPLYYEWTGEERPMDNGKMGKVVRGSSWRWLGGVYSLAFFRVITDPLIESTEIGFRCAKSIGDDSQPEMVRITGGIFEKGSGNSFTLNVIRKFRLNSESVRQLISITPIASTGNFAIDRFEVTNAQYGIFLAATTTEGTNVPVKPNRTGYQPGIWTNDRFNKPDQPVVAVDWYDAEAYCRWSGKRLPTSIEWERAAAGKHGRHYPWGDDFEADRCNAAETIPKQGGTAPVGKFSRCVTPDNIFDMAGNADEWTASDPPNNSGKIRKVIRGGSWNDSSELRGLSSFESIADAEYRDSDMGFRCAVNPRRSWLETLMARIGF